MIVWGGVMSVSIGGLFLAGVVPGVLIAAAQMGAVLVYAKVRHYPIYARASVREFITAVGQSVLALVTPVIIVGGIVGGLFTPTEASVIAVLYSMALGVFVYRTIGPRRFLSVLYDSARFAAISLFCIGTASAFGWILAYFSVPRALVGMMAGLASSITTTGILVAISFLIIGMFIDAIPAIIILGTILLPLSEHVGMHPLHFAIIGVISLAFGLVTPPYGLCLLIACALGEIEVIDALKDVAIILLPMLLILLLVIFFPELILYLPKLILPKFI
jgi:tripartite ATP-independent transporter DctM subunit